MQNHTSSGDYVGKSKKGKERFMKIELLANISVHFKALQAVRRFVWGSRCLK